MSNPPLIGQVSFNANRLPLLPVSARAVSQENVLKRNNDALSREIRVSMPAEIVSYNSTKQTATVQPLIREKIIDRQTGNIQWLQLPVLADVPVCFPQGGNYVLTMPVSPGDEVLLVFADQSFDAWYASGGIQNWFDRRRHDLSDAIAIVGINSQPNAIPNVSTDSTELRSKTNTVKISLKENPLPGFGAFKESSVEIEAGGSQTISGSPTPLPYSATASFKNGEIRIQLTGWKIEVILGIPTIVPFVHGLLINENGAVPY